MEFMTEAQELPRPRLQLVQGDGPRVDRERVRFHGQREHREQLPQDFLWAARFLSEIEEL